MIGSGGVELQRLLQRVLIGIMFLLGSSGSALFAQERADLFSSDRLGRLAVEYRSALIDLHGADRVATSVLLLQSTRAAEAGQWHALRDNLEKLVARNTNNAATWIRLARAWRAADASNLRAAAAAYHAYDIAVTETDRTDALFVLGDVVFEVWRRSSEEDPTSAADWRRVSKLVFAQIGRSVKDTKQLADKVATMDEAGLTVKTYDFYTGIRDDRRVGDRPPPLCIAFSEPIETRTDILQKYVTLRTTSAGQDAVGALQLRAAGAELCVTNLRWGLNYRMKVKAGLPALSGSSLSHDQEISGRVPSARPSLGFNTSDYILSRSGVGNVTLTSINYQSADLRLYRLTNRNFLRALAADGLATKVTFANLTNLISEHAEPIWSRGLAFPLQVNEEHFTRVPAGQLIGAWESAAMSGDGTLPQDMAEGAFQLDVTRPDNRGGLGPAAYALVVEDARIVPREVISAETGLDAEFMENPLERQLPVKWMVRSNLGLSLIKGRQKAHIVVRKLSDGSAAAGATVELLARGGRVLGSVVADDQGTATFDRRLLRGIDVNAFQAVAAYSNDDFGVLLANAELLNLSELDTSGRAHSGLIDVMAISERQIYRPGESLSALVLARDGEGRALAQLPTLELSVISDSGVVAGRTVLQADDPNWVQNGRLAEVTLAPTSPIGPARLEVTIPGLGKPLSQIPLQIRHFKPDRAWMRLEEGWRAQAEGTEIDVSGAAIGEYLFGIGADASGVVSAPVKNASVDAWVDVVEVASPHAHCYADYTFGDDNETPQPVRRKVETLARTDDTGRVDLSAKITNIPASTRPRAAVPSVYLLEETGVIARYEDGQQIAIEQDRDWIGIRQAAGSNAALDGELAFEVVSATGNNEALQARVKMQITRERTAYVWSGSATGWDYQPSVQSTPFASRIAVLSATRSDENGCLQPTSLRFDAADNGPLPLGTYRVELLDKTGTVMTAMRFRVGAQSDPGSPTKPQLFPVRLAEGQIAAGGSQTLAATDLPFATGHVVFGLAFKGQINTWIEAEITDGRAQTEFVVPPDWDGRFVHVFAKAFGTVSAQATDVSRAVGLSSFRVAAEQRRLDVTVKALDDIGSSDATRVSVEIGNAIPDAPTQVVLFAVDEGIHSITGYSAPDPFEFFHGRQGFNFEIQDVYARLIKDIEPAILGENGGDLFADFRGNGYVSKQLAVQVVGPVAVQNGKAQIDLEAFDFTGKVRLDAYAWSADRAGFGQSEIRVFDTLELNVAAPGHVLAGDSLVVPVTLRNILQASTEDFLIVASLEGAELGGNLQFIEEEVNLPKGSSVRIPIPIEVPPGARGPIRLSVTVADLGGVLDEQITRDIPIDVRSPEIPRTKMIQLSQLPPGQTGIFADQDLRARLGAVSRYDTATIQFLAHSEGNLPSMDALPSELLARAEEGRDIGNLASIGVLRLALSVAQTTSDDILALQSNEGGFMTAPIQTRFQGVPTGSLTADTDVLLEPLWRSAVALDYLQYAETAGQSTPAASLDAATGFLGVHLQRYVWDKGEDPAHLCRREVFFAGLVLARAAAIDRGSYEQIKLTCQTVGLGPLETALYASLLLAYGDVVAGNEILAVMANMTEDSGEIQVVADNALLETAMSIALLAENKADPQHIEGLVHQVSAAIPFPSDVQLDSAAWILRAQQSLSPLIGAPAKVNLAVLPETMTDQTASETGNWASKTLPLAQPVPRIEMTNFGDTPLNIYALVRLPQSSLETSGQADLVLRRRIFTTRGEELIEGADFQLSQNEMAVFVIEGQLNEWDAGKPVRISVPMPGGFEIDVSRITQDAAQSILGAGFEMKGEPMFVEAQPDRLLMIMDTKSDDRNEKGQQFSFAFAARAVVEGTFTVPVAVAEVIENPIIRGDSTVTRINVAPAR